MLQSHKFCLSNYRRVTKYQQQFFFSCAFTARKNFYRLQYSRAIFPIPQVLRRNYLELSMYIQNYLPRSIYNIINVTKIIPLYCVNLSLQTWVCFSLSWKVCFLTALNQHLILYLYFVYIELTDENYSKVFPNLEFFLILDVFICDHSMN